MKGSHLLITEGTAIKSLWGLIFMSFVSAATVSASPPPLFTDGADDAEAEALVRPLPAAALMAHDAATSGAVISGGPSAPVIKNLFPAGRGERYSENATTDVWALGNYAYTGTFNSPCGGDPEAGIWIWDVYNKNRPAFTGVISSPVGSRSNDVKVASMNAGDILVHSNESCAGGPGGFEIWNVVDPANPVYLASVRLDELNPISDLLFGGLTDVGVHNLWLFTQGERDYVAVVAESAFDNFRIYDLTDPSNPVLTSAWGAEELFDPGVGDETTDTARVLNAVLWLTDGFGASRNRFLNDVTVNADGTRAYLSNWDAGLVLLDISDPAAPSPVSVALDPDNGSLDGEVNSHAAWPSEDGTIVVEMEEDFSTFTFNLSIDDGPNAGDYPAQEGAFTTSLASLPGGQFSGLVTYVGDTCLGSVPPATLSSEVALIQRGICRFDVKATNVINAGYAAMVVFNDAARGDALVRMGGDPRDIPGIFVGHSTGLAVMNVATAGDLVIGNLGASVTAESVPDAWGGVRIWDYSDPANPVLASTFHTVCSANPVDPSCDPSGTYSANNVLVETAGNQTKAYISWYWDGMLVVDVTDPYNPVEIARFFDNSTNFLAANGGRPHDFWGVYKQVNSPWIFGSDRNGGLYVFKEFGQGSEKKGNK